MKEADAEDGNRPRVTEKQSAEVRELEKRTSTTLSPSSTTAPANPRKRPQFKEPIETTGPLPSR